MKFRDLQYKLIEIQTKPVCIWLYFYICTNNVRNVRSCFASEHNVAVNIVSRFAYVVSFVASPGMFRVVWCCICPLPWSTRHAKRHTIRRTTCEATHDTTCESTHNAISRKCRGVVVYLQKF